MISILIVFVVASQVASQNPGDFITILGWDAIDISQAPYQASVLYQNALVCGGSIISKDYILTAAKCVQEERLYRVRVGSKWSNRQGTVVNVALVIIHPDFDGTNNDIAILQLQNPIRNFTARINSIALPEADEQLVENSIATVTGFLNQGGNGGNQFSSLVKSSLSFISEDECSETYGTVTSSMICARATQGMGDCEGISHFFLI
jgi:secreted trypsin-like serine protease